MSEQSTFIADLHRLRQALLNTRRAYVAKSLGENSPPNTAHVEKAMDIQQQIDFVDKALLDEEEQAARESTNAMASHVEAMARETPRVDPDGES